MTLFVLPAILSRDAFAMLLNGMALFKLQVLDATRSMTFYERLLLGGFALRLSVNWWELAGAERVDFDLLASVPILSWSYHIGRFGKAMGYPGLSMLMCKSGVFGALQRRLAAVRRMALTNCLSHSVICFWWFRRYQLGSMEWVWCKLTEGKQVAKASS